LHGLVAAQVELLTAYPELPILRMVAESDSRYLRLHVSSPDALAACHAALGGTLGTVTRCGEADVQFCHTVWRDARIVIVGTYSHKAVAA